MRERIDVVPVTASVLFLLPAGSIEPYVGGGAGVYLAWLGRTPAQGVVPASENATLLGFHAVAGAKLNVRPGWFAAVDARYQMVRARDLFKGRGFFEANPPDDIYGLRLSVSAGMQF